MTILITGSTGLLGQALLKQFPPAEAVGLSRHAPAIPGPAHVVCDLTDPQAIDAVLRRLRPHIVIHTQAMSDVDRCEREPALAEVANVRTVEHLCRALESSGALLVAIGTDYVFDGTVNRPYTEQDIPQPVSVYGRTKLEGERVALRYPQSVIVRVSTLFGPGRANFCETIVQRLKRREIVEAFVDQTTAPTYTEDAALALKDLVGVFERSGLEGRPRVYHLTNAGACTRWEFAQFVAQAIHGDETLVRPIHMHEQQRPAARPAYSALASRYLESVIGRNLPSWQQAVQQYLVNQGWQN